MVTLSSVPNVLSRQVREEVPKCKILVVGAGGIGCEILKNLALSGFNDIEMIDLDTIDVSNLNRQFLFRKEHVGKSKSMIARETILNHNPDINIKAYHDSITTPQYGVNFFKRFRIVLNALDNRAARNHVNRMCLAADVPLIESGTAGYGGQVEFIKKGLTKCYECHPKAPQKTFPGCTIRNTPSEPVHCIVWSKHLFNQLFGEDDPDQDVSPDTADPEAVGSAGEAALKKSASATGAIERVSTREWAQNIGYEPSKLFNKFFHDDIKYLLAMDNLWKTRKPPKPLSWTEAASHEGDTAQTTAAINPRMEDMQVWSLSKCASVFATTIATLKDVIASKSFLVWDKDDKPALDFVTACSNIRSHIFAIEQKSRFDIKSIAGNIIPAIATTNAMIAGLAVLHAFRVLGNEYEKCFTTYVRQKSSSAKTVLMSENVLMQANPKCIVCSASPTVNVFVNVSTMTVKEFEVQILKNQLNMIAPDVMLDVKNVVVISSEEGETEINNNKILSEMGIIDGSILKVDDFLQNYELTICVNHYTPKDKDSPPFLIEGYLAEHVPQTVTNGEGNKENGSKKDEGETEKMDTSNDVEVVQSSQVAADDPQEGSSTKRRKLNPEEDEDDELIMMDDPLE